MIFVILPVRTKAISASKKVRCCVRKECAYLLHAFGTKALWVARRFVYEPYPGLHMQLLGFDSRLGHGQHRYGGTTLVDVPCLLQGMLTSLVPLGLVGASQSSSVGACEGLKYVFTCQGNQPHYNSRYQAGRVAPVV